MNSLSKQFGFTLVEFLVAILVFTILAMGVIALVSGVITSSSKQAGLLSDQDQARKLTSQIMQELRNAIASNTGAYPLAIASDQELIFYHNTDGGLDVERIRYYIQNGQLYRGLVKPTGNPLTYNMGTETSTLVQNNIANASAPLFYYYDGTYTGNTENFLTQPVNATQVRFIRMSMKIFNKAGVANTSSYTVNASGAIRNLKDNLGN